MKRLSTFILALLMVFCCNMSYAASFYPASSLTGGGTGALDKITGTNDGDASITFYDDIVFFYTLHVTGGSTEKSPYIIDSGDGGLEDWLLGGVGGSSINIYHDTPQIAFYDIDCADLEDDALIFALATDTGSNVEDIDILMSSLVDGLSTYFFRWDGSDEKIVFGDATYNETLEIDFENTIDNQISMSTSSGVDWVTSSVSFGLPIKQFNSDKLSDTATPHGLSSSEVRGCIINNYDSSPQAKEYDLPAAASGYYVIFVIGTAQNVTIDPNGSEIIYLNSTALSAGNSVTNTAPTIGESIVFYTIQTGAATWGWTAKSTDTDFVDLGS